jgi:formylmethanofuran dehydrogenase subunit B
MSPESRTEHVTCLGCGCGCDDLTVQVRDGRIVDLSPACPISRTWFGDGLVPTAVMRDGREVSFEDAIAAAAEVLADSVGSCLVYLGLDISSQTQRTALAVADLVKARVDTATSAIAAEGLLAAQRRGRCAATLGEIRNRADVVVFWGVDPAERYPRYTSRYALNPTGTHVGKDRAARSVIAVSVGADRSIAGSDVSLEIAPEEEVAVLSFIRASVLGQPIPSPTPLMQQAVEIAARLSRARYAVLVHDAESSAEQRDPLRAEALIALSQALNTPTRASLSSLRGGGNRVGAEAVLTSQTGYPFAVDFTRGYPRYRPAIQPSHSSSGKRVLLVVGSPPERWSPPGRSKHFTTLIIGPRASESQLRPHIAIDTGVAGIHEAGTAYRMDEVPLELTPPLENTTRAAATVIRTLAGLVAARVGGASR